MADPNEKTAWSSGHEQEERPDGKAQEVGKVYPPDKNGGTESTDPSDDPAKSEQLPMGEFRKNEGQGAIDQKPAAMRPPPDDYDAEEGTSTKETGKTGGPRGSADTRDWADRSAKEQEKLQRG